MERHKIIQLAKKKFENNFNLDQIKAKLSETHDISYGEYEVVELKKAINNKNPFYVKNNFVIGYDNKGFITSGEDRINISKMVKAVIIEDEKEQQVDRDNSDLFMILGHNEWEDFNLSEFRNIFGSLKVGTVFLPPHSAVFNFLQPSEETKKKNIVSSLSGININLYNPFNYVDNAIHEMGHLFYRECLRYEERKAFDNFFKNLKISAIYEFEWEKTNPEEVFCTIYKWYLKSILINKSFYNILKYEESAGCNMLQDIFERISRDKIAKDIFELNRNSILDFLNPAFDTTTQKYIIKTGIFDKIKEIEMPYDVLQNIERVQYGRRFCRMNKAVIPIKINENKIDYDFYKKWKAYEILEKAKKKPVVYMDMDGVVADFVTGYKKFFNRDAYKDDDFTINQFCQQLPNFFRLLPVLERGKDLIEELKPDYDIVFLTTPMPNIPECRNDKAEWIKEHFGNYDIIFSDSKATFAKGEDSILIDDMAKNLKPWQDAGGIAINFRKNKNETILQKIEQAIFDKDEFEKVENQLNNMIVNLNPTNKQKESGIYKKGEIDFKGLKIKIKNPKGSIRWRLGFDGNKWINKMKYHYGYISNGQDGADGDKVDVFLGPHLNKSVAFIINQNKNGIFDEHKIMLGFEDIDQAEKAYLSCYQKNWDGLGSIRQTNTKKIREWLKTGNLKDPFEY